MKRIISCAVTDERSDDLSHLLALVDETVASDHALTKVLADGAYDVQYNWNGMQNVISSL